MPRVRKRKAGPEQTKEMKESKEVSSPPYASLTQNSDGRFVPQFTKKQKTSKASKLPLLANDDESEGLESDLEANVIESCTIVANTAESTLEVKDMELKDYVIKEDNTYDNDVIVTAECNDQSMECGCNVGNDTTNCKSNDEQQQTKDEVKCKQECIGNKGSEVVDIPGLILSQTISNNDHPLTGHITAPTAETLHDDNITVMTQKGIGELAHEELNDSLNFEDIENICLDFSEEMQVQPKTNERTTLIDKIMKTTEKEEIVIQKDERSEDDILLEQDIAAAMVVPSVSPCKGRASILPEMIVANASIIQSLPDNSSTLKGLVDELSKLNQYILKCKREIETARKQREAWLRMQHNNWRSK